MDTQSDGSTADYYKLPADATELQHLISHRDMNAQIGEIFRSCYRYGMASHSDRLRDANKIKFYIDAEINRLKGRKIMINQLANDIHEQNKEVGWWDDPNRCTFQTLQLVSTEIAEATEAERKDLMDDHLPHRRGGEVELADALIRLLDIGGRYGWSYDSRLPANHLHDQITSIGGRHLVINMDLCELATLIIRRVDDYTISAQYSRLINGIIKLSRDKGYDIMAALTEKVQYNQVRADHKRENRAKEGGKAF